MNFCSRRYAVLGAKCTLYTAPCDDRYSANAYDEAVAGYTDPADFDLISDHRRLSADSSISTKA